MYKFGQIEIESKKFNSEYQVQEDVDLERIRVSEGVVANKNDERYIIGYEVKPGVVVPLYVRTPKDCLSSGVSRFNESSPWKMGFDVGEDEAWICINMKASGGGCVNFCRHLVVEDLELGGTLTGEPLNNGKYINPKLIFGMVRTELDSGRVNMHATSMRFPLATLREF